jgi:Ser/Thr protein kinase RdoA (MazF antagonist)
VGAARPAPHRRGFTVENYVTEPLEAISRGGFIKEPFAGRYRDVALKIADAARQPLERVRAQRIHGDLHWGNLLWGRDGPILLDFDDCCVGPPVQDMWLLARGDEAEVKHQREQLIAGYELFREFDRSQLALCEPLRAMRIIHMSGWIAKRWEDPSFQAGFPAFRTDNYWMSEYEALFRISESLFG